MNFPFFASFIVFILILNRAIYLNNKRQAKTEQSFWEKEHNANSVRKKSLDSLNYIYFSAGSLSPEALLDKASQESLLEDTRVPEIISQLNSLSEAKIVNLNYITNTDLKAAYGVANLTTLMEYDQNYTDLITLLQEYASILAEERHINAALTVLKAAIDMGSDISASYALASSLYRQSGRQEEIQGLIDQAGKLNSPRKDSIVRMLRKSDPDND